MPRAGRDQSVVDFEPLESERHYRVRRRLICHDPRPVFAFRGRRISTDGMLVNPSVVHINGEGVYRTIISGNDVYTTLNGPGDLTVVDKSTTSGTTINSDLFSFVVAEYEYGIAATGSEVFVATRTDGVAAYDATSGAVINASLITGISYPEFDGPYAIVYVAP